MVTHQRRKCYFCSTATSANCKDASSDDEERYHVGQNDHRISLQTSSSKSEVSYGHGEDDGGETNEDDDDDATKMIPMMAMTTAWWVMKVEEMRKIKSNGNIQSEVYLAVLI